MTRILLLHGPNLSQLGRRDPQHYGTVTLDDVVAAARTEAESHGATIDAAQHEGEGELISRLHATRTDGTDGIVINLGAFTHYSYALRDALEAVELPVVEVHLSNIHAREQWRQRSVTGEVVDGVITGLGIDGYPLAVRAVLQRVARGRS